MRIHVTKSGESLTELAKKHHVDVEDLIFYNPHILSVTSDKEGVEVNIPSPRIDIEAKDLPLCPYGEPEDPLDHWIPTTSLAKMAETEYDVLVVGSGAGGGAALWRLCENLLKSGKKIGLIEAGKLLLPTHAQNLVTVNEERLARYLYNPKISTLSSKYSYEYPGAIQVDALGGNSLFWSAVTPRMDPSIIESWPLSLQEMNRYYDLAENVMNVTEQFTVGSLVTQFFLEQLRANGYREAEPIPMAVDLQATQFGRIQSSVYFSSIVLLGRALNYGAFDLAINARTTNIFAENGKVQGVRVMSEEKQVYDIKAKHVVISAGAFESPRLLLHSGLSGAVGHYLTNHSYIRATTQADSKSFSDPLGTLGILLPQSEHRPYQIQVHGPGSYFWYPSPYVTWKTRASKYEFTVW
ncbi:GMC family oxidoreductase N-terminal domain-containing protein [Alkalihalobacillus sp. 1P02AB]|uniref:GMC family oxidoreductase N-terminal domain-containing protein n=1 Tax=Alkalihalobacillus sp. 1P02AB TaxID=3132260 RepID=UPI0039A68642